MRHRCVVAGTVSAWRTVTVEDRVVEDITRVRVANHVGDDRHVVDDSFRTVAAQLRDGEIVGHLTSGAYGHHLGAAIGMGYVPCTGEKGDALLNSDWEIEVAGRRVGAEASLKPLYDPSADRVRA